MLCHKVLLNKRKNPNILIDLEFNHFLLAWHKAFWLKDEGMAWKWPRPYPALLMEIKKTQYIKLYLGKIDFRIKMNVVFFFTVIN